MSRRPPRARRSARSLLGAFEKEALDYVGRVGTGFTRKMAAELFARLEPLQTKASPFAQKLNAEEARQVVFVQPKLVAEIEFRAWTADGHLRHAAYRGLREDKPAESVVRETPAPQTPQGRAAHAWSS